MTTVEPRPVDALEVLILVDNVGDALLASRGVALRPPPTLDPAPDHLLAEHGYSRLLMVERNGTRQSLPYDMGWSGTTADHISTFDPPGVTISWRVTFFSPSILPDPDPCSHHPAPPSSAESRLYKRRR
jgi:hypothetical protein